MADSCPQPALCFFKASPMAQICNASYALAGNPSPVLPGLWKVTAMCCSSSQLLRKHVVPFGIAELESAHNNYSLMPDLVDSELIKVYFH